MGYDISFHPISEVQMQMWYFDVINDDNKAREIAKSHHLDEDEEDFYENKYIEILGFAKEATLDKSFENTHGYYIANIQGLFQKFFYLRGSAFSFINDSRMDQYYKKWEEFIPDKYKAYTIYNEIQTNYYSGKFIPHNKVCQLLEDYVQKEEIRGIMDKEFLSEGINIVLEALTFAKEHGLGLLEADGVMEPNPLDLNDSTCYSNLFNCDIKGPLLYEKIAKEQMDTFVKESGMEMENMEKKMLHVEYEVEENEDDSYNTDELWYDEEEYDRFSEAGIELYGLNELDELLDEIENHSILTDPWYKRLRLFFFKGKKLKEAETTALKMQMLFKHHDFDKITILDKKETGEYAQVLFNIGRNLYKSHFEIIMMILSLYMMMGKSSFILWLWIFIFGINLKRAFDSYFEVKKITLWYERLIKYLEDMDEPSNDQDIEESVDEIIEKIKLYNKEVIRITPVIKKSLTPWSSKFGGKPYWDKKILYPTDHESKPLYMIAQLNFEEIPHMEGYPQKGILQFFIADDDIHGLNFDKTQEEILQHQNGYRVVYHEEVIRDETLLEKELPSVSDADNMPFTKEYALVFTKEKEMPALSDCMFEEIAGDIYAYSDDVVDAFNEKVYNDGSKLGGYATFTQEDPRYGSSCKEWQLLFQLDSNYDEDIEIMWGDSGIANFFIEPERLKTRDFSRVWYNWDCY